ncbi:MAG TPA: hypothetical protein DE315_05025 [Candidatus Omnitrophica bacterium]|nr:MAG: hypothetical protein A2Y05_02465 [Omnitrophica WOR_2 bacterium GWA2_53_43]HBO97607.1 hypothetical protein [Candidatus Omnitrophota bacterium]HCI44875.1 hypothetical protein [Candidatus Omnitrophota bacterium]
MIEINLAPYSLRKNKKGKLSLKEFNIPLEIVIGLGGGLIVLLVLAHVFLLVINIRNVAQHKEFKEEMEAVSPGKQRVEKVINELRALQSTQKAVEDILPERKISWAQKLNILSDSIPRGVWLKRVNLEGDVLLIEGSAISTDNEAMINVHQFTSTLKSQREFLEHFSDLELGSIQRRKIRQMDIADFMITVRLK